MWSLSESGTVKARHKAPVETHLGVQTETEPCILRIMWLESGSRL
jgi:hypothetical protein